MTVSRIGPELILELTDSEQRSFSIRVLVGAALAQYDRARAHAFLLAGIEYATSDDRIFTPRDLEASPYLPPLFAGPSDARDAGVRVIKLRPVLEIAWYPLRTTNGRLVIAWSLTNIGSDDATDIAIFLPNLAAYREQDLDVGQTTSAGRHFDQHTAFHDFTKPPVHVIAEFSDSCGNVYRQMGDVTAFPAMGATVADYKTTQIGHPYSLQRA